MTIDQLSERALTMTMIIDHGHDPDQDHTHDEDIKLCYGGCLDSAPTGALCVNICHY